MRLTDLRGKKVRTLDGDVLGHIHEVHCQDGRVVAFMCGARSFLERLTARKEGRRIPWECVRRVTAKDVVVTPDPPQRIVSGSRSRRRTPQPSARRSKR